MRNFIKIIFPLCLFVLSGSTTREETEILLDNRNDIITRNVIIQPRAFISEEYLRISSYNNAYMLSIENQFEEVIYTVVIPSCCCDCSYDLSGLAPGDYCLVLEGPSGVYEGYFYLD